MTSSRSDALKSVGLACLLLLAAILPFELKEPLFTVGPIGITSVEVCLYASIGIWGIWRLTEGLRGWSAFHTAVTIWAAAVMLSAILAVSHKAEALKFALRSLGGCALGLVAADFVCTAHSAALVALALVAGSCLSALAALAEIWVPGTAAILMRFKTQPSLSGSYLRASGTFQYANIASMYWESTLALAVSIPAWWRRRQTKRVWFWAGSVSALVLIEAILLGASRAGVAITFLVLAGLLCLSRGALVPMRNTSGIALFALCALLALHFLIGSLPALRLTTQNASNWYRAEYEEFPPEATLKVGEPARIRLTLRNTGKVTWHVRGPQATVVTYHWLDPLGKTILIWQGARSELPAEVQPGGSASLAAEIIPPSRPGSYLLQWDMVQDDVAWFSVWGSSGGRMKVEVLPSGTAAPSQDFGRPIPLPLPALPTRTDLWGAAARMWLQRPWVGVGPDNFRHLYGPYLGKQFFDDRMHANSFYFEVLATTGLMGMLAGGGVLCAVAISIRRGWRRVPQVDDRLLAIGLAAALAAFCLHGVVDYFLSFTPTYGLFWLAAGMTVGLGNARES